MDPELLFGGENSWTLFNVGGQTFFGIITLKEDLLILALNSQGRFHGDFPPRLHSPLDAAYSLSGLVRRRELTRVLHNVFHEAVALEDIVHNAEFKRFLEGECVARDHQFDGFAFSYHAREP